MKIEFTPEWCETMAQIEDGAAIGAGCASRPTDHPQLPIRVERDPDSPDHFRLYDQAGAALAHDGERVVVARPGEHTRFDTWDAPAVIRDRVNAAGSWVLPGWLASKSKLLDSL